MAGRAIRLTFVISGALLATAHAGGVRAAGFQLRELSAPGVGTAMSGATSAATDYSTAFTNPAGMTRFGRSGVQADLSYVLPSISFSGTGVSPLGTFYGGGDGGDAGEDKLVPAFYGVWAINPRLALGLSLNAPFGLATQYDDGWTGRYFALESEIQNPVLTPSLAWKATDKLSLGAGIQIGYADATLSRAVNLSALGLPDATSELKGDDYGVGYTLGMLYEFTPTSRIGLSYRSSVDYTLDGSATFSGVPDGVAALVPALSDSDATAKVTTPDVVSLGAYHEFSEKWTIMSEVSWTNWSTFKELRVKFDDGRADDVTEENWDDSWFFSLGAEYHPFEQHTFRFGVAYDESPVPDDSRTARIPDSDRYWLSLGYAYDFAPGRRVNIGYTHIFFDDIELAEATSSGSLTGDYTGSADVVSAGIQFSF